MDDQTFQAPLLLGLGLSETVNVRLLLLLECLAILGEDLIDGRLALPIQHLHRRFALEQLACECRVDLDHLLA